MSPPAGFVSLVGAGPGDPDHLTFKAARRLREADLVLYDALVTPEVLALAVRADHVFVGKRAGHVQTSQAAIHEVMIAAALQGQRVVRLKGGDPFVFGRGSEEALALQAAGVPYEVVPGVSSAVAAPALAGIPLTHRGISAGVVVLTGADLATCEAALDALPPDLVTVVLMMSMATRAGLARRLVARGWPADTPAAVILGAATPQAWAWKGPLERSARGRGARRPGRAARHDRDRARRRPAAVPGGGGRGLRPRLRRRGGDRHRRRDHALLRTCTMSAHHALDSTTHGRARLSFATDADIDEFADVLGQFERGEITPEQWRVFRLVRGTYGQRQLDDAQMIRVKIPQGMLTAAQLDVLADVAERYSRGFGHITTRQNVQIHFVKLHDVEPAMRRLADAGLTTREACGNSVRNITACQFAGVAADEPFDVTPYAEALTRFLLRHRLSAALPRKFKIAFEGCTRDHIKLTINDIGWLAQLQDGRRGFRVYVGGGTSTMTFAAPVLVDFMPAEDLLRVAEAIVRVFHERGDYQHRQRNRMKFLIKAMGWEGFRAAFEAALAQVRADGVPELAFDAEPPADEPAPEWGQAAAPPVDEIAARVARAAAAQHGPGIHPEPRPAAGGSGYARWLRTNVRPQKQEDYVSAVVTVPLGDLSGEQYPHPRPAGQRLRRRVGARHRGAGRGVPLGAARRPARSLRPARGGRARPGRRRHDRRRHQLPRRRVVQAGGHAVARAGPGARAAPAGHAGADRPGAGSRHQDQRLPERLRPASHRDHRLPGQPAQGGRTGGAAYFIQVGGGIDAAGTTFGRLAAKVPARRAPEALERLVRLYAETRQPGQSPVAFFRTLEVPKVKALLANLEALTPDSASDSDFIDLAETTEFRPSTTEGECAV